MRDMEAGESSPVSQGTFQAIWDLPKYSDRTSIGPFSTAQYRQLLTGMMGQGHGIEAMCLFLTLTRDVLLDLVVLLDLSRPHDAACRRVGGSRAWSAQDYAVLLAGWMGNWPTLCIAEQIGR